MKGREDGEDRKAGPATMTSRACRKENESKIREDGGGRKGCHNDKPGL